MRICFAERLIGGAWIARPDMEFGRPATGAALEATCPAAPPRRPGAAIATAAEAMKGTEALPRMPSAAISDEMVPADGRAPRVPPPSSPPNKANRSPRRARREIYGSRLRALVRRGGPSHRQQDHPDPGQSKRILAAGAGRLRHHHTVELPERHVITRRVAPGLPPVCTMVISRRISLFGARPRRPRRACRHIQKG